MNGQISGRSSEARNASTNAWRYLPSRWRSTPHSVNATIRPSELPSAIVRTNCELMISATAATTPAVIEATLQPRLVSRAPRRNASITARIAPPRATISHRSGAASPNSAKTVVKSTGNGFHDGPPVVCRSRWRISRPHTIHAHGS